MSMSDKYLGYLDSKIEIAPANTQEEVIAADIIETLLNENGLSVQRQDIMAPAHGKLVTGIAFVLLFVGIVVAGINGIGLAVLGFVIAVLSAAILFLLVTGHPVVSRLLPPARSQNVIGVHRGCGPHAGRGVRPIIVMAHYDTGHEELLAKPALSPYSHFIYQAAPLGAVIALICAVIQLFGAGSLPCRIFWIIGMIAALPGLLWGINNIVAHFGPLTGAANDNNASVAAMLGVSHDVMRAMNGEEAAQLEEHLTNEFEALSQQQEPISSQESQDLFNGEQYQQVDTPVTITYGQEGPRQQPAQETVAKVEATSAVRHGQEVLESLGILPPTCQIIYRDEVVTVGVTPTTNTMAYQESESFEETPIEPAASPYSHEVRSAVSEPTGRMPRVNEVAGELHERFRGLARSAQRFTSNVREHISQANEHDDETPVLVHGPNKDIEARQDEVTWADTNVEPGTKAPAQPEENSVTWADTPVDPADMAVPSPTQDASGSTQAMPIAAQPVISERVQEFDITSDPSWGTSSFTPANPVNVARRAALFDLPDPSVAAIDPLAMDASGPLSQVNPLDFSPEDFDASSLEASNYEMPNEGSAAQQPVSGGTVVTRQTVRSQGPAGTSVYHRETVRQIPVTDENSQMAADAVPIQPLEVVDQTQTAKRRAKTRRANRKNAADEQSMASWLGVDEDFDAKSNGESIGSWDSFNDDDPSSSWKGGATRSEETREGGQGDDLELQDAVLSLGDVDLVAHDIWFVAVGASELDHAGAKAFIENHRKDLRGAFLINLDSVGAGQLTALSQEGLISHRRADRRLLKFLGRISKDLHIPLAERPRPWADTDATPAMRASIRSVTLMGCDPGEVPALAHTAENIAVNVDPAQVSQVNKLVSELIRRS